MREKERVERERQQRAEEMSSLAADMPGSQYGGGGEGGAPSVSSSIESKVESHNTVRLGAGAGLDEGKRGDDEDGGDGNDEDDDEDLLGSDVDMESVSGDEGGDGEGDDDDDDDDDGTEDSDIVYVAEEEGGDAEEDEEWSAKERQLQEELKRTTHNCRTLKKTMEQMRKTLGKTGKKAAAAAAAAAAGAGSGDKEVMPEANAASSHAGGVRRGFGARGGSADSPLAKAAARAGMHSEIAEDDEETEDDDDDDDYDDDDDDDDDTDDESEGYTSDELEDDDIVDDDDGSGPSDALSPVGGRLSDRIADLRRRLRGALGDERFEAA